MKRLILQLLVVGILVSASAENAVSLQYLIDDGVGDNAIGLTEGGDLIFLNQFDVVEPFSIVTSIEIAWGSIHPAETSATVALWDDPDNDGDPDDADLLVWANVTAANLDTDIFNVYDIPDTTVSGNFFVGALITQSGSYYPARWDSSSYAAQSWVAGHGTAGGGDINDLMNNDIPVSLTGDAGFAGNWMVRANAEPIPEPATMLLLGTGLIGLAGFRKKFKK